MDTETADQQRSRVRRSRRKKRATLMQRPELGVFLFLGMCAVTVLYVGVVFNTVRLASFGYGMLGPGMSRTDTRYMVGPPIAARQTGGAWRLVSSGIDPMTADEWRYNEPGGGITRATFDADGKIDHVECGNDASIGDSCPSTLGLSVGTDEGVIWNQLGRPDRQQYAGDAKIMSYDGLGIAFTLRRLTVVRISLTRHTGFMTYLGRAFRSLVP